MPTEAELDVDQTIYALEAIAASLPDYLADAERRKLLSADLARAIEAHRRIFNSLQMAAQLSREAA